MNSFKLLVDGFFLNLVSVPLAAVIILTVTVTVFTVVLSCKSLRKEREHAAEPSSADNGSLSAGNSTD